MVVFGTASGDAKETVVAAFAAEVLSVELAGGGGVNGRAVRCGILCCNVLSMDAAGDLLGLDHDDHPDADFLVAS